MEKKWQPLWRHTGKVKELSPRLGRKHRKNVWNLDHRVIARMVLKEGEVNIVNDLDRQAYS